MATEDKKDVERPSEPAEPPTATGNGEELEPRGVKRFIKSGEVRDLITERWLANSDIII